MGQLQSPQRSTHSLIDLVVQTRHRWEKGGLEHATILDELERVPLEEADFGACHQGRHVDEVLEHVGCREIRNVAVSFGHLD